MGEVDLLGLVSVLNMVRGAYLTTKRGLRVGEVDLLGLVISLSMVSGAYLTPKREASVWVKLTSLVSCQS